MPKCEDDMLTLAMQRIELLVTLRIDPHRPPQPSNHRRPDGRKHRELQPCVNSLLHSFSSPTLITHHRSHITVLLCIRDILKLHRMEPLVLSPAAKQLVVRPHFDDRAASQDHDPIGLLNRRQSMGNDDGRPILH